MHKNYWLMLFLMFTNLTIQSEYTNFKFSYKKEKKYLKKLRYCIIKHADTCANNSCLQYLIPPLPEAPSEELPSLQEDIDHIVLHRLNVAITACKSVRKNFDPHAKIHNKTLLQHTVENGYVLATNRLLSEYAQIEPSLFTLSLRHGTTERICEINKSLKKRLKTLNKIDIIPRKHAKKICHLYKKLKEESPNNAMYNQQQYKKWRKLYKSMKK
jgi:hypothetical protein